MSLSQYQRVYLGWVDLHADDWQTHGYETKEKWQETIDRLNGEFQKNVAEVVTGKQVEGAKDIHGKPDAQPGLYIAFKNVVLNRNERRLYMDVVFLDAQTGKQLFVIQQAAFKGDTWAGFENDVWYSLDALRYQLASEINTQ